MDLWVQLLGGIAIISGLGVIVSRHPLRSILCAGIQTASLAWLLFLNGFVWASVGLLVVMALIYAAAIQLVRAVGAHVVKAGPRFAYGQVIGLLAAALFGIYLLLITMDAMPVFEVTASSDFIVEIFGYDWSLLFVCGLFGLSAFLGFRILWAENRGKGTQ